ncbi:unnamed protein product, partial [Porites evermanni]
MNLEFSFLIILSILSQLMKLNLMTLSKAVRVVCSGVSYIGISDHSLIYVYRKLSPAFPSKGHSTISYRNFKNFNRENFRNDIAQQDWTCNGPDDSNVLHFRIKKAPWINSELKKGMRDRDAAKRKAMASNDPRDWAKYKKLRNTINNNIKT